jgi:hypothetical protein
VFITEHFLNKGIIIAVLYTRWCLGMQQVFSTPAYHAEVKDLSLLLVL